MRWVSIVAMALYVLVTLVAIIFDYGQAAIAQQASPPPGIPSADNSTSLRNFTNSTGGTNATSHAPSNATAATPLGIPLR